MPRGCAHKSHGCQGVACYRMSLLPDSITSNHDSSCFHMMSMYTIWLTPVTFLTQTDAGNAGDLTTIHKYCICRLLGSQCCERRWKSCRCGACSAASHCIITPQQLAPSELRAMCLSAVSPWTCLQGLYIALSSDPFRTSCAYPTPDMLQAVSSVCQPSMSSFASPEIRLLL